MIAITLGRRARRSGPTALGDALVGTSGFILADVLRFGPHMPPQDLALSALLLLPLFAVANYRAGLHRRIWRHANLADITALATAVALTATVFALLDVVLALGDRSSLPGTVPSGAVFAFLLLLFAKTWPHMRETWARSEATREVSPAEDAPRLLVVGAGEAATLLVRDLQRGPTSRADVVGFIDDNPARTNMRLHGLPILGTRHDLGRLVAELSIDVIAIALPHSARATLDELVLLCQETGARVEIMSDLSELAVPAPVRLRELTIADLLGRDEVTLDVAACAPAIAGQVVLVTGAAGSIGSELCHQLLHLRPRRLVVLDTNETGLFDLEVSLRAVGVASTVDICIADITDQDRMARVFAERHLDVVFHAAAYKHVPLLESHAADAVKANVRGTAVLCRLAHAMGVGRFVFISSDKAVAPTSNLGYSKRLGELLVRAYARESDTVFCAVRFGNVLGSRGSVIPTFERQIAAGEALTVTHPAVTRYFMSIPEAACLVIQAGATARSGQILMLDMGAPVSIKRLAETMLHLHGLRAGRDAHIVYTGLRPGEKLHETLTAEIELTQPAGHAKILAVLDPYAPRRADLETTVWALEILARREDNAVVGLALRDAALGLPLPAAAQPVLAAAAACSTAELAATSATAARMAAHLAEQVTARAALDRHFAGLDDPSSDDDSAGPREEHRVVDFPQSWVKRHS